jgi:hypothetical protein
VPGFIRTLPDGRVDLAVVEQGGYYRRDVTAR